MSVKQAPAVWLLLNGHTSLVTRKTYIGLGTDNSGLDNTLFSMLKRLNAFQYLKWKAHLKYVKYVHLWRMCSLNIILTKTVMEWISVAFNEHIEAETKWPTFSRQHFEMDYLEWKLWISI